MQRIVSCAIKTRASNMMRRDAVPQPKRRLCGQRPLLASQFGKAILCRPLLRAQAHQFLIEGGELDTLRFQIVLRLLPPGTEVSGRVRLDGLARWLQDVAYADVEDAGLAERAVWVVRRTRIRVERFPREG